MGVAAVDISLGKLTEIAADIKIGKTGYIMIIQGDGTVLANPRDKETVFKKMGELPGAFATLGNTSSGLVEDLVVDGVEMFGSVYVSPETKWKFIALIERNEIMATSQTTILQTVVIGFSIALLFWPRRMESRSNNDGPHYQEWRVYPRSGCWKFDSFNRCYRQGRGGTIGPRFGGDGVKASQCCG